MAATARSIHAIDLEESETLGDVLVREGALRSVTSGWAIAVVNGRVERDLSRAVGRGDSLAVVPAIRAG
jgi:hypothetical protein